MLAVDAQVIEEQRRPTAPTLRRTLFLLFTLVLTVGGWRLLAPPAFGGTTSYYFVTGTSMLPRYHTGDVVIAHAEDNYRIGEVVAYKNRQLGVTVLHRIVGDNQGRFVLKGDSNDFQDSFHPTRSDIVGAVWVHVHEGAPLLAAMERPSVAGAIIGLLLVFAMLPKTKEPKAPKAP